MLIKYGEMAVELKCSSGFLVDHMRSISTGCGSLPYKSIENIFKTQEPYGQSKSKDQGCSQNVITSTDFVHETDSLRRVNEMSCKALLIMPMYLLISDVESLCCLFIYKNAQFTNQYSSFIPHNHSQS